MVVTAHQPNYLPGLSIIRKIEEADAVIWLDEVQYSHDGWTNRNRMPDGSWLTIPVERGTDMAAMNRVRISEHGDWRRAHVKTLTQHYGGATYRICKEIKRPYRLLIGLNLACLRVLLGDRTQWHFQSHLDGGRPAVAVSMDPEELKEQSLRLARMVVELGGDTYLSGPSGLNYLDEEPFHERGVAVEYFQWAQENRCSAEILV